MKQLAANPTSSVGNIFGTVAPPGPSGLNDPGTGLSQLITTGIQLAFSIAGIMLLFYLFYGAFLYISSGGEEEKVAKARNTITYAVIGIVLLIASLTIFIVVAGNILGIIKVKNGGIIFNLPSVNNCGVTGSTTTSTTSCCSGKGTFQGGGTYVCN